jgi:hypothetical protein
VPKRATSWRSSSRGSETLLMTGLVRLSPTSTPRPPSRSEAIWRRESDEWRPLLASGFANEAALHDLVADAPHLLPMSGDPSLVVGREVTLGVGRADLLAVEADGRRRSSRSRSEATRRLAALMRAG